jgi:chemotaxis protein CheX
MKFAETELRQITEDTWRIVLGEELEPSAQTIASADIDDCIAGTAQIAGDWQLAVVIYGSAAMARHAATVMFALDAEPPKVEDVQDAMCELVNIVTGNIKGVLSGSSHLSLPTLIRGNDFKLTFPRHILLSEAAYNYAGEPVVVTLLGEDKLASRLERGNGAAADNP